MGPVELIVIALSQNVSFTGKTWWTSVLVLRVLLVLLAGFSLFRDDPSRFVCNTIQPGCSNVCFDAFAPVSVLHLWLLHCVLLCLPHLLFGTYVTHQVLSGVEFGPLCCPSSRGASPLPLETSTSSSEESFTKSQHVLRGCAAPRFYWVYLLSVVLRIVLEAFFGVGQFLLFGLSVPKSFLCHEAPCTSGVECYVSQPTEKTLMLHLMLGVSCCSVLLSLVDLGGSVKAIRRWRAEEAVLMVEISKGEQGSVFTTTGTADEGDVVLTRRTRPSGSSNDAVKDGNHGAGGSNGELLDTNALSPSTANPTCERFCSPAHFNPRSPSLVRNLVLYSHPGNSGPQDKRAWV